MAFDPKQVKAGDPISALAWNELGKAVKDDRRISGGAGIYARNSGNGLEIAVAQPDEMDFRITGGPNGDGGYEWKRVTHSSAGDHYWVDSGITGGVASGDPVYPRNFGLPKPHGRVLVLIPPLKRKGNFIHAGQAWLSFGLGLKLPADDTVYHAVRADGDSAWVFDPTGPELSTTDEAKVYVCCNSSSSSSSASSDGCPTLACKSICGLQPVSCLAVITVQGLHSGDLMTCDSLNATYFAFHLSGCTWFADHGEAGMSPTVGTATLTHTGGGWVIEIVGYSHSATFSSPSLDCYGATVLTIDSTDCPEFTGATATVVLG